MSVNQAQAEGGVAPVAENGGGDAAAEAPVDPAPREDVKKHPTGRTVIVRNLPPSMLFSFQEELRNEFSKYGNIGYVKLGGITVDQHTINPTLTAFMNFSDTESSDKAMESNGVEMGGNSLELQVLRSGEYTAVLNNIPAIISEDTLRSVFSPCGNIKKILKIPARPTAFIEFDDEESLNKMLSLNGTISMNNTDVTIHRQGAEIKRNESKNKAKKSKIAARVNRPVPPPVPRGPPRGAPRGAGGPPRGGRGRVGIQPWMQSNWGGNQFNQWDQGDFRRNFGGNNNWGNNGNFPNMNEDQMGFKRRKQNDWMYKY